MWPGSRRSCARSGETRLGDAIRATVNKERGGPIAGIVVMTDGGNNAGMDCDASAKMAQAAGIPVFAVGLGSDRQPINARVVDLEAPKRVFPGDKFTLTGYLQAYGLEGRLVNVQLLSAPADMRIDAADDLSDESHLRRRTLRAAGCRRRHHDAEIRSDTEGYRDPSVHSESRAAGSGCWNNATIGRPPA